MGCKVILMLFIFVAAIGANDEFNNVCKVNQQLIRNLSDKQAKSEQETKALAQQMAKIHQELIKLTSLVNRGQKTTNSMMPITKNSDCANYKELTKDIRTYKILETSEVGYFFFDPTQVTSLTAHDFCRILNSTLVAIHSTQLMQELNSAFENAGTGNLGYWVGSASDVKIVRLDSQHGKKCMFATVGIAGVNAGANCAHPPKSILCKIPHQVAECFLYQ